MNILFVHQNFPGQFKHLAPALADQGHRVVALKVGADRSEKWKGVEVHSYRPSRSSSPSIHPWVVDFETKIVRAEACLRAAFALKRSGFNPQLIVAHPSWGESLFLKDIWPAAKLAIYCEFFYSAEGRDVGFDPEFPSADIAEPCRIKIKNLVNFLHFDIFDAGLSPTAWQANTYPLSVRDRISIIHDGIDTEIIKPNTQVRLALPNGEVLTRESKIITFVNRNLEPYRGYHMFMRALPRILEHSRDARIFIVGGDGVSYGQQPPVGSTWKRFFFDEIKDSLTTDQVSRIHYLGILDYDQYLTLLQLSSVHVYLTYPFVLSWSMLEAMSAGCVVVGSKTPPVEEVITDQENGLLVDFFDHQQIAEAVCTVLDNPLFRKQLADAAQRTIKLHYDLKSVCLPAQIQWVENIAIE